MRNGLNFYIQLGLASIFCIFLGSTAMAQCPINCAIGKTQVCPYHPKHRNYNKPTVNSRGERIRYVDVQTPYQQQNRVRSQRRHRSGKAQAQTEQRPSCPIGCPIGESQPGDCPYHPQHLDYNKPTINSRGERIRYVKIPRPRVQVPYYYPGSQY